MDSESVPEGANGDVPLLAEQLRFVSSVVPAGQELEQAGPQDKVGDVVEKMLNYKYSQVPVVLDGKVLGMFSFRSLVSELVRNPNVRQDCSDLPVHLFMEDWRFVAPSERWESILDNLNRDNGVLVRWPDQRLNIVTTMDVVQFLTALTSSFMLLAEIELALRQLICTCIPSEQLDVCIHIGLGGKYSPERMPKALDEMEFGDYVLLIGDTHNWTFFSFAFGDGDVLRKDTVERLDRVRLLRNTVFHFKRRLTASEEQKLTLCRDWLHKRIALAEPRDPAEKRPIPWNQGSFLRALQGSCGKDAVSLAKELLAWGRTKSFQVKWGEGKTVGSFHLRFPHGDRVHHLFSVWSNGDISLWFWRYAWYRPFESADERRQLLAQLNAIEGIQLPEDTINGAAVLPYTVLLQAPATGAFLSVFDSVLERIQST
jgi:hypothetical protein